MIHDMRIRIAGGLLLSVVSVLGSAQLHAAAPGATHYACEGRQNLAVERDGAGARVSFAGRSYELRRKTSSIGVKYESSTAALIIDGPSAIFVAEDRLQLGACTKAFPIASAR